MYKSNNESNIFSSDFVSSRKGEMIFKLIYLNT